MKEKGRCAAPSALTYQPHAGDRETRTCAFDHRMERSREGGEAK